MRILGLKTLRHSARWLRSQFVNAALILGYHRVVTDISNNPFDMCVSARNFVEQLNILHQYANPLSLEKIVECLREGNLPERAIAITFDDGYTDVLYHAKPVLEHYQIPATVFVTTEYLGREFWWDRLERIFSSPVSLPQQISRTQNDKIDMWSTQHPIHMPVTETSSDQRQKVLFSLYEKLLSLSSEEREHALTQLGVLVDSESEDQARVCGLTPDELIELSRGGLVEIGAHSASHPSLAQMSIREQRAEIQGSKASLEEILNRPVTGFSYPNGSYTGGTQAIVREAGFSYACASKNDVVWTQNDIFQLPRFWISDWDGKTFLRWLKWWLAG